MKRAFWFHYNKPASRKAGHPVLTIHYRNSCIQVTSITCHVPVRTRVRKQQPHCVMAGHGQVYLHKGQAVIL